MDTVSAIAVLTDALQRCRTEDMRTPNAFAALDFLAARASVKWPFEQFRKSLDSTGFELWEAEARWQTLNASLNGIKLAITPNTNTTTQAESVRKREWVFEPPSTGRNKRT
jgi:hypothetical protein